MIARASWKPVVIGCFAMGLLGLTVHTATTGNNPGHVFIAVKSGTLTVEDGCGGENKLSSGQGLEKWNGRVHRGKNVDATDVVVYDIFFTSPAQPTTVTIPENEQRCGPPRNAEECANNGWRRFNHPRTFANQGQCANFVRDMPRTVPFPTAPNE